MSHLTKHPHATSPLWLRLGRVLTLTGVISLLAVGGFTLLGCTNHSDEVVVIIPTPAPATPHPTSLPTTPVTPTATPIPPNLHPNEWVGLADLGTDFEAFTLMLNFRVRNQGEMLSPASTVYVFDGMVDQDGELIGQVDIPRLDPNQTFNMIVPWNVKGQAGNHQIFRFICLVDVAPSPQDCKVIGREFKTGSLSSGVYVSDERELIQGNRGEDKPRYYRGDQVPVTVWAANLEATITKALTITTRAESVINEGVLGQEVLRLAPRQIFSQTYFYDTAGADRSQVILTYQIDGDELVRDTIALSILIDAYFTAEPVTGPPPLTVTLTNLSTLQHVSDSWEWNFGNGITSTQISPTYTYTHPGSYTVTLTIAIQGRDLGWVNQQIREGTLSDPTIVNQTFFFTHTEQIEVQ